MAIAKEEFYEIVKTEFPNAEINITALVDDNDHYLLEIKSNLFNGKTRLEQHRMVNSALKSLLSGRLHALQIKTITRE